MALMMERGFEFVDALSEKIHMCLRRWIEATEGVKGIRVEFYVAIPDEACRNLNLTKSLKQAHSGVGILRVKPNGTGVGP
jgi:hypothetical protein